MQTLASTATALRLLSPDRRLGRVIAVRGALIEVAGLAGAAQIGSVLSSYAIASVGPQEYRFNGTFLSRFEAAYGPEPGAEVAPYVGSLQL